MDKMNISQLSYSKYRVLTHNNQDYFVHYRPIKNCIKNLLSNPDILKNLMFRYENSKVNAYIRNFLIINNYINNYINKLLD